MAVQSSSRPSATPNTSSNRRATAPLLTILRSRIKQPQFYWFLGHFLTLYHFIRFHLSFFSLKSQEYHYSRILLYISVTYAIVLYQFYKSGQLKMANFVPQLKQLDNLQYFSMLTILFVCSQSGAMVNGSLYSPVIFSLFHSLNYFKENLLPFLPLQPLLKAVINNKISLFIQNYNEKFLQMAQVFEIMCGVRSGLVVLPIACFKVLIRFNTQNLATVVALTSYVCFFKLRFMQSESIRLMMNQYVYKLDTYVNSRLPPQLAMKWQGYKHLVKILFSKLPV